MGRAAAREPDCGSFRPRTWRPPMLDESARRTLRRTAKRGGVVSAGAIVAVLAGGRLAVGVGSPTSTTNAPTGGSDSLGSTIGGLVPKPVPQPSPGNGLDGVVDTVSGTVTDTVD